VSFRVLGVGEVLWDLLPAGAQPGGAPANFACHARALGADAAIVSRVGDDALGRDILRRFEAFGLPAGLVQVDESAPTGTVGVELDAGGVPRFTIHGDAAWDRVLATQAAREAAAKADAVCFGSLGQRAEPSRSSVQSLVAATPLRALRIFDVNLRQPFYSPEVLEQSLRLANVLKLNDAELPVLASLFGTDGSPEAQLEVLARRFSLRVVALTRGARGSLLRGPTGWDDHPGLAADVVDTVGAGDAFTAALTLGLLLDWPLDRTNAHANEVACHVCGCAGATPSLPPRLVDVFASASPGPGSDR
jgi:fructokinase